MKRKRVVIYQENNAPIQLVDEDERNLEDYSKSLSQFLTKTNISILQLSTSSLIIRPSKITSAVVEEIDEPDNATKMQMQQKQKRKKPVKKSKEVVDIITDAD